MGATPAVSIFGSSDIVRLSNPDSVIPHVGEIGFGVDLGLDHLGFLFHRSDFICLDDHLFGISQERSSVCFDLRELRCAFRGLQ